jgi:hypothetical protein
MPSSEGDVSKGCLKWHLLSLKRTVATDIGETWRCQCLHRVWVLPKGARRGPLDKLCPPRLSSLSGEATLARGVQTDLQRTNGKALLRT